MHPLYLLARPRTKFKVKGNGAVRYLVYNRRLPLILSISCYADRFRIMAYSGDRKFRPKNSNRVSKLLMLIKWLLVRKISAKTLYPPGRKVKYLRRVTRMIRTKTFHIFRVL